MILTLSPQDTILDRTTKIMDHRLHLDQLFNSNTIKDIDNDIVYQFMPYGSYGTPQGEWIRRDIQDGWIPVPTQPEHATLVCISRSCLQKTQNAIESLRSSGLDVARLEDEIYSRYQAQARRKR